jgi:hypothetical protein
LVEWFAGKKELDFRATTGYNSTVEMKMTVAELIAVLQTMPQDLQVEMAMRMEYQEAVTPDMVVIQEYDGRRYVLIDDCA